MEEARKANVQKFISASTANIYPSILNVPFQEEDIWSGFPEDTNAAFGIAKRMQIMQSQSYRKEFDFNSTVLVLSNLYGPGDNFNLKSSNVIPSLIKKIYDAKIYNQKKIELWGDGNNTRDFLHVKDAARSFILAAERYDKSEPLNIASGIEVSIKKLAKMIMKITNINLEIFWNEEKPMGQLRRLLDIKKVQKELKFKPEISLQSGLKETISWYKNLSQ